MHVDKLHKTLISIDQAKLIPKKANITRTNAIYVLSCTQQVVYKYIYIYYISLKLITTSSQFFFFLHEQADFSGLCQVVF